jgi:hypothetical protein
VALLLILHIKPLTSSALEIHIYREIYILYNSKKPFYQTVGGDTAAEYLFSPLLLLQEKDKRSHMFSFIIKHLKDLSPK